MRYNIKKDGSTKAERILYEAIKQLHVPFRHRVRTLGIEIDFLIGTVAIEVNGHGQNIERSKLLASNGYVPIHMSNEFIRNNRTELKKILSNIINYGTITPSEHSLPRS